VLPAIPAVSGTGPTMLDNLGRMTD